LLINGKRERRGLARTQASFEFDGRHGAVRAAIVEAMTLWLSTLTRASEEAQKIGRIKPQAKAGQLALEVYSMAVGAHRASQLLGQRTAFANARETIRVRLQSASLSEQRAK
jgi:hypothetical protein